MIDVQIIKAGGVIYEYNVENRCEKVMKCVTNIVVCT